MVEEIYKLKNELLGQIAEDVKEHGIDRLDGEKVDMVKDLAEAEKDCWKASYYRAVTEAMEGSSGYQAGYAQQPMYRMDSGSMGYQAQSGYRDSMGRFARRGYNGAYSGYMDGFKRELKNADPQQREQMMHELREMGM